MVNALGTIAGIAAVAGALAVGLVSGAPVTDPTSGAAAGPGRSVPAGLPLAGEPTVVHPFDAPAARWGPGHRGVDLAGTVGQVALAPVSGIVTFAGTVVDRGVLTITDPAGRRSTLEPVQWSVQPGTHVERGDPVGTIQAVAGHCAPAICLHWGVRQGEVYLDPLTLVRSAGPVVLLPDP